MSHLRLPRGCGFLAEHMGIPRTGIISVQIQIYSGPLSGQLEPFACRLKPKLARSPGSLQPGGRRRENRQIFTERLSAVCA